MDLLFSKYASPYFFIDEVLSVGRLREFVYSVVKMENERKMWDIYLALVANPYAEVGSFDEFKHKHTAPKANNIDLGATVKNSRDVLLNFKPAKRGEL